MREIEENKWMEERPDENKDVLAVFSRGATHIYLKKVMASSLKKKKNFFEVPFASSARVWTVLTSF